MTGLLFRPGPDRPVHALLRTQDDFGLPSVDLLRPPGRFWAGDQAPTLAELNLDQRRTIPVATPAALLAALPAGESWLTHGRRSVARLFAWYLVAEDPQRRLEQQAIAALAHQVSLVSHVLREPTLQRVLIADEVGLGKTIEAGLILRDLFAQQPGLRVLYLAPARLAANVRREFDRLGLGFRLWVAGGERDGKLDDPRLIASIHRAAHEGHFESIASRGNWDVVVVDECHHLSDWGKGGGSPVRKFQLVKRILQQLSPAARVIFMSGTPHQGHPDRFRNLLSLLTTENEPPKALAGRVIFRTKDDVRDWEGRPLFPGRRVNPAVVIELGESYKRWLTDIHDFYAQGSGGEKQRAAGWRAGQALQWATSSPEAGLGYLVRQALRADWTGDEPELQAAISAIRPYRGYPADEPVPALLARLRKEVDRQQQVADVEDIEDVEEDPTAWRADNRKLAELLRDGVGLIRTHRDTKWTRLYDEVLADAGDEKVVLFAQPIETVMAVSSYLERKTGQKPALIIGGQEEEEREAAIKAFWRPDGPQFLVSSRAGGEGLNLQIARRLVHLDVPWNPMELEQRVGRVHRFLSRRTIIVDTLVVQDSREVDAYRVARRKLEEITKVMVSDERFDALFARVMSLVPPDEFLAAVGGRALAPLTPVEEDQIAEMVRAGVERWQRFHSEYAEGRKGVQALDPGRATWDDVARFAEDELEAKPLGGFSALTFRWEEGEVVEASEDAPVLQIGDQAFACGDFGGMPVTGPDNRQAQVLGLNVPLMVAKLREVALPELVTGAAHLRWPAEHVIPVAGLVPVFGLLVMARQSVRFENGKYLEQSLNLHWRALSTDGRAVPVPPEATPSMLQAIRAATVRRQPENAPELIERMQGLEREMAQELRMPTEEDRANRIVHAVTPLFSAIFSSSKD